MADDRERALLRELALPSPAASAAAFLRVYGILAACLGAATLLPLPWPLTALVFLVVSAQQYALAILTHEGQHYLLAGDRRVNDRLAAWLAAAPIGSNFFVTRRLHFAHHDHLGEADADPERYLHSVADKVPLARWLWHFVRIALGWKLVHAYRAPAAADAGARPRRAVPSDLARVGLVQATILGAFWAAGWPAGYLHLWIAPLVSTTVLLDSLRQFCEHARRDLERDLEVGHEGRLITHLCHPVEAFFLAPLRMNYHAEHHLYPFVPQHRLPRLSRLIRGGTITPRTPIEYRRSFVATTLGFVRAIARGHGVLRDAAPAARP